MTTDFEIRERAEELYVIDGLTLEETAKAAGVSERTIQLWSAEEKWRDRQKEYRNAASEIKRYTRLTKLKLIKGAMTSLDPQAVYAFAALERATVREPSETETGVETPCRDIKTPEEAVEALEEAVRLKLNRMLSRPDTLKLSAIKDMQKALELIEKMKTEYKPETEKKETATEEDKKRLIDEVDKILGAG